MVFYDAGDRWFKAVKAQTGEDLWRFQVSNPVVGSPFSFTNKGKQYVGVMAGIDGIHSRGLWGSNDWWGNPIKVACSPGGYNTSLERGYASDYGIDPCFGYLYGRGGISGGILHVFSL